MFTADPALLSSIQEAQQAIELLSNEVSELDEQLEVLTLNYFCVNDDDLTCDCDTRNDFICSFWATLLTNLLIGS